MANQFARTTRPPRRPLHGGRRPPRTQGLEGPEETP